MEAPHLDIKKLIKWFGGRNALERDVNELIKKGWNVPRLTGEAIQKWTERGSLPCPWLLVMFVIAKKKRRPLTLHDFIVTTSKGQNPA